jgi:hypothetical protein
VAGTARPAPPQIGAALDRVRAAVDLVAHGDATRITVLAHDADRLLPAARSLARRAGVRIELVEPTDPEPELSALPLAASDR